MKLPLIKSGKSMLNGIFDVAKFGYMADKAVKVYGSKNLQYSLKTLGPSRNMDAARSSLKKFLGHSEATNVTVDDNTLIQNFRNDDFLNELNTQNTQRRKSGEIGRIEYGLNKVQYGLNKTRNMFGSMGEMFNRAFESMENWGMRYGIQSVEKYRAYLGQRQGMRRVVEDSISKEFDKKYGAGAFREYERKMTDERMQGATKRFLHNEFDENRNITYTQDSLTKYYQRNPNDEAFDSALMQDDMFMDYIAQKRRWLDQWYESGREVLKNQEFEIYNQIGITDLDFDYKGVGNVDGKLPAQLFEEEFMRFMSNDELSIKAYMSDLKKRNPEMFVTFKKISSVNKNFEKLGRVRQSLIASSEKIKGYYPGMFSRKLQEQFLESKTNEFIGRGDDYNIARQKAFKEAEDLWMSANEGRLNKGIAMSEEQVRDAFNRSYSKYKNSQQIALSNFIGKPIDQINLDPKNPNNDFELLEELGFFTSKKHIEYDENGQVNPNKSSSFYFLRDPEEGVPTQDRKLRGYTGESPTGNTTPFSFWDQSAKENSLATIRQFVNGTKYIPVANHSNFLETRRIWNVPIEFLETDPIAMRRRFSDDIAARLVDASHGIHSYDDLDSGMLNDIIQEVHSKYKPGTEMSERLISRAKNAFIALDRDMNRSDVYESGFRRFTHYLRNYTYATMSQNIAAYDYGQVPVTLGALTGLKSISNSYGHMLDQTKYNNMKKYLYKLNKFDRDLSDIVGLNDHTYKGMDGSRRDKILNAYVRYNSENARSLLLRVSDKITGMDGFEEKFLTSYGKGTINSMMHANASLAATAGLHRVMELTEQLIKLGDQSYGVVNGRGTNRSSILDQLERLGVDIRDGSETGDVAKLMKYHENLANRIDTDLDMNAVDMVPLTDVVDRVIHRTVDDYTGRNVFNRGEALQSGNPMQQLASTFFSYTTNQKNIVDRVYSRVDRWMANTNDELRNTSFRRVHQLYKQGKFKELRKLGLTSEQIETFPAEELDRFNSIIASVPLSAATRLTMGMAKAMLGKAAIGALSASAAMTGVKLSSERPYQRDQDDQIEYYSGVPIDTSDWDDDRTFRDMGMPDDFFEWMGTTYLTADFYTSQMFDTGNMGPGMNILNDFTSDGDVQVPIVGTTLGAARDLTNFGVDAYNSLASGKPMDINSTFNMLRRLDSRAQFANKSQQ